MKDFLTSLGLAENNNGTSTGNNSFKASSFDIASHSPVDGKLIGKVKSSTKEDYEKVMRLVKAQELDNIVHIHKLDITKDLEKIQPQ